MATIPPAQRKPKKKANPLRAGQNIDYKDVATLRKFISERGKIRARRVTGLSVQEQRRVAIAIKNAREVALLPYARRPAECCERRKIARPAARAAHKRKVLA